MVQLNFKDVGDLSTLTDTTALFFVHALKDIGAIQIIKDHGYCEFMYKTGHDYSKGILHASNNQIEINKFDKLTKIGNDGWFIYERWHVRYKQ